MRRFLALSVGIGVIALVGCGGGGGTTGGRTALLVTDSFREDFAHVWATVYRVELLPASGAPVTLFDDPSGRTLDLKTLRDAGGARYALLGAATVPSGTYVGVRVTIGAQMRLFRPGNLLGESKPITETVPRDPNGHAQLTLNFPTPRTLGNGSGEVLVDFDLARFLLSGGKVIPALGVGDPSGLHNPERHEREDYHGRVGDLSGTAPQRTFTLNRGRGMTLTVTTTAATAIYGSGELANGAIVEVKGAYNPATGRLVATRIEVNPGASASESLGDHTPEFEGSATDISAAAGTFTLTVRSAKGFNPPATSVNVRVTDTTVFRSDGGRLITRAAFFAALAVAGEAEVEGAYDDSTNTFTALRAKIEDESRDGGWEDDSHHDRDDRDDDGDIDDDDHGGSGHG